MFIIRAFISCGGFHFLCQFQIRTNAVNPTVTKTEMFSHPAVGWDKPEKAKPMLDRIPLGKFAGMSCSLFLIHITAHFQIIFLNVIFNRSRRCGGANRVFTGRRIKDDQRHHSPHRRRILCLMSGRAMTRSTNSLFDISPLSIYTVVVESTIILNARNCRHTISAI